MKPIKRILTTIISVALSGVMLFSSNSTAFAVENSNFLSMSSTNISPSVGSAIIEDGLNEKLADMDEDDVVFVVYSFDPQCFSEDVREIEDYVKHFCRTDEIYYHEESQTYYVTKELEYDYKEHVLKTVGKNGKSIRDEITEGYCQSFVWFNFKDFEMHVYATKSDIESFLNLENGDGIKYAKSVYLGNPEYYNEAYGVTWDDFDDIFDAYIKYVKETQNINFKKDRCHFYALFDEIEGRCVISVNWFDGLITPIPKRYKNKYIYVNSQNLERVLFYDEGKIKNAAVMYDEGKITLEDYYRFGALLGDVNLDMKIDVVDVTYFQMHLAGYEHSYEEKGMIFTEPYIDNKNLVYKNIADITYDDVLDVSDITSLQMMIAGYELDFEE